MFCRYISQHYLKQVLKYLKEYSILKSTSDRAKDSLKAHVRKILANSQDLVKVNSRVKGSSIYMAFCLCEYINFFFQISSSSIPPNCLSSCK